MRDENPSSAASVLIPSSQDPPSSTARLSFWDVQLYGLAAVTFTSFFPGWFHLQEYLLFSLLAAVVFVSIRDRTLPLHRSAVDLPLGLFVIWVLGTVPFATDPGYSLSEWRKFVTHALAFYWTAAVIGRQRDGRWKPLLVAAIVTGCLGMSVYAVGEFVIRGGSWQSRAIRAGAPSSDYNWLSTYIVLALPMLIAAGFVYREWRQRIMVVGRAAVATLAQVASLTRAGWLAHVVQAIAVGMVGWGRRMMLIVVIGLALVGGGLMLLTRVGGPSPTMDPWTFESRIAVWKLGADELLAHPLTGIGYGNNSFLKRHPEYDPEVQRARNERERVLPAMHSTFIMVALGGGVPALVLFIWLFAAILRQFLIPRGEGVGRDERVLLLGAAMAILGFAVRNIFDYMFAGSLSYLFWILAAFGVSISFSGAVRRSTVKA